MTKRIKLTGDPLRGIAVDTAKDGSFRIVVIPCDQALGEGGPTTWAINALSEQPAVAISMDKLIKDEALRDWREGFDAPADTDSLRGRIVLAMLASGQAVEVR